MYDADTGLVIRQDVQDGNNDDDIEMAEQWIFMVTLLKYILLIYFSFFLIQQEWSSMESSSYENWDEIEMLFGHLVIGNLQFVINNWQ